MITWRLYSERAHILCPVDSGRQNSSQGSFIRSNSNEPLRGDRDVVGYPAPLVAAVKNSEQFGGALTQPECGNQPCFEASCTCICVFLLSIETHRDWKTRVYVLRWSLRDTFLRHATHVRLYQAISELLKRRDTFCQNSLHAWDVGALESH